MEDDFYLRLIPLSKSVIVSTMKKLLFSQFENSKLDVSFRVGMDSTLL